MSFSIKKIYMLLILFLYLISCGGDSDSEIDPAPIDYQPTAVNDVLVVDENSTTGTLNRVTVSKNDDIGKDGSDGEDYSLLANASNGNVTEVSDGVFEYIPALDYSGLDSFTYIITDADGD